MMDKATIDRAKKLSPASLWIKWGYAIKYAGDEIRVYKPNEEGCLYRSVLQADGCWLSGMADAGVAIAPGVGDNISLVQHFTRKRVEKSFDECISYIFYICKDDKPVANRVPTWDSRQSERLSLPAQTQRGDDRGRLYLGARGISRAVSDAAEKAGLIRFSPGNNEYAAAVFFLGYRQGDIAYASKRCIEAPKSKDTAEKRDMGGSDKTWVPVFKGDPSLVVITEGGINALSILELFQRAEGNMPTVIMTGGGGNLKWAKNPYVQQILEQAQKVWLMGENDSHLSEIKQDLALKAKEAQRKIASDLAGREAGILLLPQEYNDINDVILAGRMTRDMEEILKVLDNHVCIQESPTGNSPA